MKHIVGNYEIEFPTTINGGIANDSGFITPLEKAPNQTSQFFIRYPHNGQVVYDTPEIVPEYVKKAIVKITSLATSKKGE